MMMTTQRETSFWIEAIVESPATADERLRTVEGVRAEIASAVECLGATVALLTVREIADDEATEGGRR